ncbi:MAG: hypothetical protein HN348_18845 [Proteobacteria bacterium]|nr:hypothetical protein [Pseudomonadota bacterium]
MASSIHTNTVTLRFLEEHEIMGEHMQGILDTDEVEIARNELGEIREIMAGHMLIEEGPQGAFDLFLANEPRLAAPIEKLKDDHNRLRTMLKDLAAAEGQPDELKAIKDLVKFFEVHEIRENAALEAAKRAAQ